MNRIYLDYAATTPLDRRVVHAMREFELKYFGNPSSAHRQGQQARAAIDFARAEVAKFLNCKPQEIIFTSGATEANNHAIRGIVQGAPLSMTTRAPLATRPHVITTELEHHSVYNVVKDLQGRGVIEATFVKPDRNGIIAAEQILKKIKDNTVLISCIFVSNEIGSVLPIREIGKALQQLQPTIYNLKPVFHVDAVQAAKFYNCNVEKLNCDLLTLAAHKLYGPKGVGCLYVKQGTKLDNLMLGGAQEYGLRPGTQNTSGIIGFAKALELLGSLEDRKKLAQKIQKFRDQLWDSIKHLPGVELNGPQIGEWRSPENLSVIVSGIDQDSLITALDLAGISASTGSACVSGSTEPSHVIRALGKPTDRDSATVRFSLGKQTTAKDIYFASQRFTEIMKNLKP